MYDDLGEFKLSKRAKAKLKNKPLLKKELARGKTAQEIMGFSEDTMAKFYRAAHCLLEGKRYSDAANAFIFLVTLNPYQHDYWLGLGMSTQMYGDFEAAVDAYEMAAISDIENPIPYFYLAKCLFSMHDRDSALQAFELAIECAGERPSFQQLKTEALAAQAILMKHH